MECIVVKQFAGTLGDMRQADDVEFCFHRTDTD